MCGCVGHSPSLSGEVRPSLGFLVTLPVLGLCRTLGARTASGHCGGITTREPRQACLTPTLAPHSRRPECVHPEVFPTVLCLLYRGSSMWLTPTTATVCARRQTSCTRWCSITKCGSPFCWYLPTRHAPSSQSVWGGWDKIATARLRETHNTEGNTPVRDGHALCPRTDRFTAFPFG